MLISIKVEIVMKEVITPKTAAKRPERPKRAKDRLSLPANILLS
jgi:hypothetical protein